jgi:hypothetical protein
LAFKVALASLRLMRVLLAEEEKKTAAFDANQQNAS